MKTKHTPGPWVIENNRSFPMIVARDGGKYDGACICPEVCNGEANARLIAAAPELLEACKIIADKNPRISPYWGLSNPVNLTITIGQFNQFCAAIAKAEGGEK